MLFKKNKSNLNEFSERASKAMDEISNETKKADEENKKILKNTAKIGGGCMVLIIVGVLVILALIVYLIKN